MAIRFDPDDLREAALEHMASARLLFTTGGSRGPHYSSAIYIAGLAVECMLRGYRLKRDPEFDSRHDLSDLMHKSGFADVVPDARKREISAALADVWARWKNEYRYTSDRRLLADLKRRGLTDGIRGDQLKENARILIDSAYMLINVGVRRWNSA